VTAAGFPERLENPHTASAHAAAGEKWNEAIRRARLRQPETTPGGELISEESRVEGAAV
jgi:hypothetical protein